MRLVSTMESTLDTISISPAERMNVENRFARYSVRLSAFAPANTKPWSMPFSSRMGLPAI